MWLIETVDLANAEPNVLGRAAPRVGVERHAATRLGRAPRRNALASRLRSREGTGLGRKPRGAQGARPGRNVRRRQGGVPSLRSAALKRVTTLATPEGVAAWPYGARKLRAM